MTKIMCTSVIYPVEVYCDCLVDPGNFMGLRTVFHISLPKDPSQSSTGPFHGTPLTVL